LEEKMSKLNSYKKILIIDDEEIVIRPIIKYLTLMKFQVNVATSGEMGIDLYGEIDFDVAIVDLKMTGMSGMEVIDLLVKRYPNSKIIVITGFLNDKEFQEIKNNPYVSSILEKPFELNVLLEKIKEVI